MDAEIDTGRVAFALAQTTLSMLVGSGVLNTDMVQAAARNLEADGTLGMSQQEITALAGAIRSTVEL